MNVQKRCEVADKIQQVLDAACGLRRSDLTPSQVQALEKLIREIEELRSVLDQEQTDSSRHLKLVALRILLGKLCELAIEFFKSRY